jgi:hypothetical protein
MRNYSRRDGKCANGSLEAVPVICRFDERALTRDPSASSSLNDEGSDASTAVFINSINRLFVSLLSKATQVLISIGTE